MYDVIGRPLDKDKLKTIHVGGTNGKGSLCFKLAQHCTRNGSKTGLFVSPHICSFRERIQVNNHLIDEDNVVIYLRYIFKKCIQYKDKVQMLVKQNLQ